MSVTWDIEGGVAERSKPKEKAHLHEGVVGHVGLPGWWGRWQPRKRNGPVRWPGPTGLESKERLKSNLIFEFKWIFRIWQDLEKIYKEILEKFGSEDFS
jgi:hypothetical protein